MEGLYLIAGIVIFIVIIGMTIVFLAKKRMDALIRVARSMNLEFSKNDEEDLLSKLGNYKPFSKGRSKIITNIMKGNVDNVSMYIMDYSFTTSYGRNDPPAYTISVIMFNSDDFNLPHFTLSPEKFFHKIGNMLGFKDINFSTHPVFSKKYHLKENSDKNQIKSVFNKDVLDYFSNNHGWSVEGCSNTLIVYRASKIVKPAKIRSFMEECLTILALFRSGS
jgi:hypothetical protein